MGVLGDMIVRIKGDTSQMVQSLQQTDRQVKQFAKVIMGAGAIGGVILIFKQLGRAVGDVIKLVNEQQEAEGRLASAIKATGKETSISVQAIASLANRLQKTTTYGDELTLTAAAMLQQLGDLDEKGLKRLIPRVQNFAAAMGLDLVDAAKLVGKTLGTSTNALAKQGIEIDKNAKGGDRLEAVIAGLDSKFAGMAETIGKTTVGQLKILQNQFNDLRQELAFNLLPVLNKVLGSINYVFTELNRTKFFKEITSTEGIGKAISSLSNAAEAVAAIDAELKHMNETIVNGNKGRQTLAFYETQQVEKLQKSRAMILQVMPLLEKQQEYNNKNAGILPKIVELTEKETEALFKQEQALAQASEEWKEFLDGLLEEQRLKDEIAYSTITLTNAQMGLNDALSQFYDEIESRGAEVMENHIEAFQFGAEELRNWEEASKRLSAQFAETEQEMTSTLMTETEARNAIRQSEWDLASALINAIAAISDNYYKGLLDNENLSDKERKKIMRDQAKAQKSAGIFGAIINTAEAVTKALSSAAPPFNFILAALSAAAGGLQIAAIASQPLPKLAKGGKLTRPTMFMGGEAGPEWVVPELKLDELGGRIAESMQNARINNTIVNDQPIQLSVNLGGRELEAYITQAISNRRILVREGSVAK